MEAGGKASVVVLLTLLWCMLLSHAPAAEARRLLSTNDVKQIDDHILKTLKSTTSQKENSPAREAHQLLELHERTQKTNTGFKKVDTMLFRGEKRVTANGANGQHLHFEVISQNQRVIAENPNCYGLQPRQNSDGEPWKSDNCP